MNDRSFDETRLSRRTRREARSWALRLSVSGCLALASSAAWAGAPTEGATESAPEGAGESSDAPAQDVRRFALVVGSNATLDAGQAALRFADDDAARVAELLEEAGASVELLTTFDRDSQARFGALVGSAERPQHSQLEAAMKRLGGQIQAARAHGLRTEFIFYYSGHGDVGGDGRSYLTLEDGPLTRHDLFAGVLGSSGADVNHVLLDACQSEEFVLSRGEWKNDRVRGEQAEAVRDYLEQTRLEHFPNTGVLLASSVDQQTHEWERFQGGIFTHELLSGLRGAADINGDGAVEYSELGAFVSAANRGVQDPRARLDVTVLPPPSDQRAPVLRYAAPGEGRVLYFAGRIDSRYELEDARGVRLADLRRSPGRPAYLRVPDGDLFLRRGAAEGSETKIAASTLGIVEVEGLEFRPSERAARGALDQAFRKGLFEVPYGLGYYAGYTESADLLGVADPDWQVRVWGRDKSGELVEVARVEGQGTGVEGPEAPTETHETTVVIEDEEETYRLWGAVSVGLEFTPYNPVGEIVGQPKRIIANQFHGFTDSGFGRPLRGVDLRWWGFDAATAKDRPRADGYFRTGYTQGAANFVTASADGRFVADAAARLEYFTVPLFFAGNIYAFKRFPLRPFAGAGAGFDILSVEYTRVDGRRDRDVSARIGFELHAGLDLRINNWFSLVGEVRQLWSARRRVAGLPDYSNEGLTFVSSVRVGFPLTKEKKRRKKTVKIEHQDPALPPAPAPPPEAPEASEAPEAEGEGEAADGGEAAEALAPEADDEGAGSQAADAEAPEAPAQDDASAPEGDARSVTDLLGFR